MSKCNRGMQLAILFVMALVAAIGIRRFCSNRSLVEETSCGVAASESRSGEKPEDPVTSGKPAETENCVPGDTEAQHGENADSLVPLPTDKPLPYRIKHAVTYGAEGKITVRVVDSKGDVVEGAEVSGGFYNSARPIFEFKETTDGSGLVTITGTCSGDANIRAIKSGFYKSNITYWFFKNYFDCVKDGRWIPWNPTVEIVLKEIRKPIQMTIKSIDLNLPLKNTEYGVDLLMGELVSPYGKGQVTDVLVKCWGDKPYPPSRNFTNELLFVSASIEGGFIRKKKDTWSEFLSDHEAPEAGYSADFHLSTKRSEAKVFENIELPESDYLIFKLTRGSDNGDDKHSWYGKIYGPLIHGIMTNDREGAGVKFTYYLNPTPDDRNLEAEGRRP